MEDGKNASLVAGHYDLVSLAKEKTDLFSQYNYRGLETETNAPLGQLVINNFGAKQINLDHDLAKLFGIGRKLVLKTIIKQFTAPMTYLIHCDLIDKNKNLFNGKSRLATSQPHEFHMNFKVV